MNGTAHTLRRQPANVGMPHNAQSMHGQSPFTANVRFNYHCFNAANFAFPRVSMRDMVKYTSAHRNVRGNAGNCVNLQYQPTTI
nr:MAG TPA: hypothetical protein [Caudoviricetes sp.]